MYIWLAVFNATQEAKPLFPVHPCVLVLSCQQSMFLNTCSCWAYLRMRIHRAWFFLFFVCCMLAKCFSWMCRVKNLSLDWSVWGVCACDNRNHFLSDLHGSRLSPPFFLSSLVPLSATFSVSFSVRTGYLQPWIQSIALFSPAPPMETLRTWPLQVRQTCTCTFIILYTTIIMSL